MRHSTRATRRAGRPIRPTAFLTIACLLAALAGAVIIALTMGAAGIPLTRLPAALGYWPEHPVNPLTSRDQLVLWSIRIPRIAAAAMVGSLLAASGAVMQGLFRNPLADPALVGVSSGGAFAAAAARPSSPLWETSTVILDSLNERRRLSASRRSSSTRSTFTTSRMRHFPKGCLKNLGCRL